MKAVEESASSEPVDVIELSKQGYFTILLDENLRGLEAGLQLATRKGNFWLKVRDNGSFHLEQLV